MGEGFGAVFRAAAAGMGLATALVLGAPQPANAAGACEYTTLDRHCVAGGVYRIILPAGDGPFPVVVYLYGSGGHSREIINYGLFQKEIVDKGYALIVPAAKDLRYITGRDTGWSLRNEVRQVRDEVTFLRNVMRDASSKFRLDQTRILFTGQSRGAFLAWEIACHEPDMASAYAVHAGGYLGPLPERCKKPVHFLHGHGTRDRIVPMRNASWVSAGARMAPLNDSLELLAQANGCQMTEKPKQTTYYGVMRRSWQNCSSRRQLDFLIHQGGHNPPRRWFPAILDWFEASKSGEVPPRAVIRSVGTGDGGLPNKSDKNRLGDRFKGVPQKKGTE